MTQNCFQMYNWAGDTSELEAQPMTAQRYVEVVWNMNTALFTALL